MFFMTSQTNARLFQRRAKSSPASSWVRPGIHQLLKHVEREWAVRQCHAVELPHVELRAELLICLRQIPCPIAVFVAVPPRSSDAYCDGQLPWLPPIPLPPSDPANCCQILLGSKPSF